MYQLVSSDFIVMLCIILYIVGDNAIHSRV